MKPVYRFSSILVLVAFGYGTPLVLAVQSYKTSGRAFVLASKLPPMTEDWGATLGAAYAKGIRFNRKGEVFYAKK